MCNLMALSTPLAWLVSRAEFHVRPGAVAPVCCDGQIWDRLRVCASQLLPSILSALLSRWRAIPMDPTDPTDPSCCGGVPGSQGVSPWSVQGRQAGSLLAELSHKPGCMKSDPSFC